MSNGKLVRQFSIWGREVESVVYSVGNGLSYGEVELTRSDSTSDGTTFSMLKITDRLEGSVCIGDYESLVELHTALGQAIKASRR